MGLSAGKPDILWSKTCAPRLHSLRRFRGGRVSQEFSVLDVYRRYKQFKPQGISELNEGGWQLARALAEEVVAVVDRESRDG
jgi:hypothetical protein